MKKEVIILNDFSDRKDCLVGVDKMAKWLCKHGLKISDIVSISLFARKVDEGDVFDIWLKTINVSLLKALSAEKTFTYGVECYDDSIQLSINLKAF